MRPIVGDALYFLHPEGVFLSAHHLASSGEFLE
jgi:hypothetical protein